AEIFRLAGPVPGRARLVQVLIGAFLPMLLFLLVDRAFRNRKAAFWSAALAVFYPTFLYYDASLLITSTMVILIVLLISQLYRAQENPTFRNFIFAGVWLGLAGLARPNILLLGPALAVWVWLLIKPRVGLKPAIWRYLVLGAVTVLVILPVTVRNYRVGNDFVFIAWQGGFNFYLGNNSRASGWSATAPGIDYSWEGGYRDAIVIAENEARRPLKRSEISDYWYRKTFAEIKQHPGAFLALQFKKIRLFINGFEIPNNQNLYFAREYASLLKPLMFTEPLYFPFGVLAPLAIIGLGLTFSQWRQYLLVYLMLASYTLSFLLFFICARYRQPLIPFMLVLAVLAVMKLAAYIKNRQYKNITVFTVVFIILALESNHDLLKLEPNRVRAEDYFTQGAAQLEYGRIDQAEENFKRALAADSTHGASYNNLGMIYANRNEYLRALPLFQKAVKLEPQVMENYFNYATALISLKNLKGALDILEEARRINPLNYYVHYKLGMTYYQAGEPEKARSALAESLRLNPDNDHARQLSRQIDVLLRQWQNP
ncbi:MAG: tetratricopeptide repeat protein, partial [Candidatus Zixiibacteriota bacterium]